MRTHFLPIWLNSKKDYLSVSFIKIQFYFYLYKNIEIVTLSVFVCFFLYWLKSNICVLIPHCPPHPPPMPSLPGVSVPSHVFIPTSNCLPPFLADGSISQLKPSEPPNARDLGVTTMQSWVQGHLGDGGRKWALSALRSGFTVYIVN